MSILTKQEILKEIKKGNIKIEPLITENIGPGSVDLSLGNKFRIFKKLKKIFILKDKKIIKSNVV